MSTSQMKNPSAHIHGFSDSNPNTTKNAMMKTCSSPNRDKAALLQHIRGTDKKKKFNFKISDYGQKTSFLSWKEMVRKQHVQKIHDFFKSMSEKKPKFGEQFASKLDREIEEKKQKAFERRKQKIEYKKMLENKFISVEARREEYQKMLEEKHKTFYDNYLNKAQRSQDHIQQKDKELKRRLQDQKDRLFKAFIF